MDSVNAPARRPARGLDFDARSAWIAAEAVEPEAAVLMRSPRVRGARAPVAEERTPVGINLAGGAVAVVAGAFAAAALPASYPGWRLGIVALAVGGFAAFTGDQLALAGVVLLGWLVANGFLENRSGELSWHGSRDFLLATALVLAAAVGLAAGDGYRQLRDLRARWLAELDRPPDSDEEECRDG
jgi:MFS family permease